MRNRTGRGKRRGSKLVQIPKRIVGNDESSTLRSAFQSQAERHRERPTVVSANAPREPIGLRRIEIRDMNNRVIDETPSHPSRRIGFFLDLLEPNRRLRTWVPWAEVCDHVREAGMVNGEQYRGVLVLDEVLNVAVDLDDDAALVEHPQCSNDCTALSDVVGHLQPRLSGGCACRGYQLRKSHAGGHSLGAGNQQEEPGCL
jgi:hypothetical protein